MSLNQSTTQPITGRGRGRGGRPPPVTRVPASLVTSGRQDVQTKASQGVPGGAFPVVIGGPQAISITFHHPIGVTPHKGDDWIATPTEDVALLLARAKNPGQQGTDRGYETFRLEAAVTAGLLVKQGSKYFLPGDLLDSREDRLEAAKAVAKGRLAQGQNPSRDQILAELTEELRTKENVVLAFIGEEDLRKRARDANPLPAYETRGGPLADRPQVPLPWLKGKAEQQARDLVIARLCAINPL